MQYEKIMGLDYGDVRIGIAFSDLMGVIASAYETYKRVSEEKDLEHICNLIAEYDVKKVVIGLPYNMDGTEGIRAEVTKEFANKLAERAKVEIIYQDERLSSVSAEEALIEAGVRREKRKNLIDKVAASIILQCYLDSAKRR